MRSESTRASRPQIVAAGEACRLAEVPARELLKQARVKQTNPISRSDDSVIAGRTGVGRGLRADRMSAINRWTAVYGNHHRSSPAALASRIGNGKRQNRGISIGVVVSLIASLTYRTQRSDDDVYAPCRDADAHRRRHHQHLGWPGLDSSRACRMRQCEGRVVPGPAHGGSVLPAPCRQPAGIPCSRGLWPCRLHKARRPRQGLQVHLDALGAVVLTPNQVKQSPSSSRVTCAGRDRQGHSR